MNARPSATITHARIFAIAVPIMISNITEPLIGIVDTAIVGQLPQSHYIGAIAIAAVIFDIIYWGFGSLRMSTGGLAAQAFGANDMNGLRAVFARAILFSLIAGALIIILSPYVSDLSFWLIEASSAVEDEAKLYFDIRIWSAPFALINYAVLGWFIGMGKTGQALVVQLVLNLTNMALDALFVLGFAMTADGVALGTLLAEIIAAILGLALVARQLGIIGGRWSRRRIFDRREMTRTLTVNTDIMVRSICLSFSFAFFAAEGARAGNTIVAANAILMHMILISAFFLDAFAFALEALAGQAVGARNRQRFWRAIVMTSWWAGAISLGVGTLFWFGGGWFIDLLSVNPDVRATARLYLFWAALAPVIGVASFQFDGLYAGTTRTRDMRNMMIVSLVVYLTSWYLLKDPLGNHGLWLALMIFFAVRAVTLGSRVPAMLRALFKDGAGDPQPS